MHRVLVVIALALATPPPAAAKTCSSIDVRNAPSMLEKLRGCTSIAGHLMLVLMDTVRNASVFDQFTFPELTEITDYMIVFSVSNLTTLGGLFPNLRAIKGVRLFNGTWALGVYKMQDMQEIGLYSLQHIGRGAVFVDRCPNLCHVNTVNWGLMGASKLEHPDSDKCKSSDFCPIECPGRCWNNYRCQNSGVYCPHYIDNGTCVTECPKTKVVNEESRTCLTEEECKVSFTRTSWVFNRTCIDRCPPKYERDTTTSEGCRYVGDNYITKCSGGLIDSRASLAAKKGCTHITEHLDLRIRDPAMEPLLQECLGNIVSIQNYLRIGRSTALKSLEFLSNLTVIKGENVKDTGTALFVFENENLEKLWEFDGNFKLRILRGTIGFHNNPKLCLDEIEKLSKVEGILEKVQMQISRFSNGYASACNKKPMKITLEEINPRNVTISWEAPEKSDSVVGYSVYFGIPSKRSKKDFCDGDDENSWDGILVRENRAVLKNLEPYQKYWYYIKTYTTLAQSEQTPRYEFMTSAMEPSSPRNIIVDYVNATYIWLLWDPPQHLNGDFSRYIITVVHQEDTPRERDYCEWPHETDLAPKNVTVAKKKDNCSCEAEEFTFYRNEVTFEERMKMTFRQKLILNDSDFSTSTTDTIYEISDLKPYSLYMFYVRACNKENDTELCGHAEMKAQRTAKKATANVIQIVSVQIVAKNVYVDWSEPEETNSDLVSYNVEYKRTDSEHSKPRFECITHEKYSTFKRSYSILQLSSGKYAVRVRAISYGGPGPFTDWQHFEIETDTNAVVVGSIVASIVVALVIVVVAVVLCRKKPHDDVNHLIPSINPDYAGPIYVEDNWEIDRKDVEVLDEIGHGSFGMVYRGLIKSRNYPCAIKTVNESASLSTRMEFLNEGAVMKSFNDAHHVIKLIGIVSRGQPPLVVMELMDRGDLKSFLRRCRDSSQNLTTNELYRMAAEIADGMAYLAAKKYIHRDLAARNCMVGGDRTVKIGDFGMARDVYETDYYKKDTAGFLPVRWMAPESLADGVFTSDSDVWSYGIVLWEMATLAEQPYQGMSNDEVFRFVKNRGTPRRPEECSDLMYEVMKACWKWRPNDRPTFSDIVHKLAGHVGEDFSLVAFTFTDAARHTRQRVYNPPAMLPTEDDYAGHYHASDDDVSLYMGGSNRPHSSRRRSPLQISPGSPSSEILFSSS